MGGPTGVVAPGPQIQETPEIASDPRGDASCVRATSVARGSLEARRDLSDSLLAL